MADFDYDTDLGLKRVLSKQNELLRLAMPRLEYAKHAALADLDPGPAYAAIDLNRVLPIIIYLEEENPEAELSCRFLMYELLASARFNVIAEMELYGSKLIVLFGENSQPTTSEAFLERVRAIPFRRRLQEAAWIGTVIIGFHAGFELYQKLKPESRQPTSVVVMSPEVTDNIFDLWHKIFNAQTAEKVPDLIESALTLAAVFKKEGTEEE